MRFARAVLALSCFLVPALAQEKTDGPTNEKAQKTYKEATQFLRDRRKDLALDEFKKADKQDGGHCPACQKQMLKYGVELGDWKAAELAAEELLGAAQGDRDQALAHYQFALVLMQEGLQKHKDDFFARAHDELVKALAPNPNFPEALKLLHMAAVVRQDLLHNPCCRCIQDRECLLAKRASRIL